MQSICEVKDSGQIARRCNSTRNLYAQDVEDLRKGYTEVWQGIHDLLKKFETL